MTSTRILNIFDAELFANSIDKRQLLFKFNSTPRHDSVHCVRVRLLVNGLAYHADEKQTCRIKCTVTWIPNA